jgi:hypothetical protein
MTERVRITLSVIGAIGLRLLLTREFHRVMLHEATLQNSRPQKTNELGLDQVRDIINALNAALK